MADKNKNRKSSTSPAGRMTRKSEDGSFEIVVDGDESSPSPAPVTPSRSGGRRLGFVAIAAVILLAGVVVVFAGGEEDEESTLEDASVEEAPSFQPYAGGSVNVSDDDAPEGDQNDRPTAPAPTRREAEPDDLDGEQELARDNPREMEEDDPRLRREPDGENYIEDVRGDTMSRREAQERLRHELDSVEDAETDFAARLRRRDVEMNSRVIQNHGGSVELPAQIEVSRDVQRRIQDQFSREDDESVEGVDAENYRQDGYYDDGDGSEGGEYDDDQYYEDEYYDDEEHYDDEYYEGEDDYYDEE